MTDRMDPVTTVLDQWSREATVLERCGHGEQATVLRRRIEEIRDAMRRRPQDWLDTAAAVRWSGYTRDHLQNLAREDRVQAEWRDGQWYFIRGSLPRKPRPEPNPDTELRASERAARRALG